MARCECPYSNISSLKTFSSAKRAISRKLSSSTHKRNRRFKVYLEECRFDLVKEIFLQSEAIDVDYEDSWILAWMDGIVPMEKVSKMKPYQRINHFPGISEVCRKDLLAINMKRMQKLLPKEYDFTPLTFCLPEEFHILMKYFETKQKEKKRFFIIKPYSTCQGAGIDIVKGISDVKKYKNVVFQKYVATPFLMERFKVDLRLYVLMTSINPLRLYVYKEGLVRLATVPYKKPNPSNLNEKRMHLTNYAINRNSKNETCDGNHSETCKRSLSDLLDYLDSLNIDHGHLWQELDSIIVKTILSVLPKLRHAFQASYPSPSVVSPFFEVLGFDILLNKRIKTLLLEVNRSPSLGGRTDLDQKLKKDLIRNVIDMVLLSPKEVSLLTTENHIKAVRRLTNLHSTRQVTAAERVLSEYREKREKQMMGNFRQLYPITGRKYEEILQASISGKPVHTDLLTERNFQDEADDIDVMN